MSDPKIETVQKIYAAFGRGDVPAILAELADDVDWAAESAVAKAPWYGPHDGKTAVPRFFQGISEALEMTEFTPLSYAANDTDVFVTIRSGIRVRATGKAATSELHHWWRFEGDKIAFYRGLDDSELTASAFVVD